MFYCGFGGDFCGQSTTDDVNPVSSYVILAFVNTQSDGSVIMDEANYPKAEHDKWKAAGKKIIISAGGQNGHWDSVFHDKTSITNFCRSINDYIKKYNMDGVDIDIEGYHATPRVVADMLIEMRTFIGNGLLIVSPECVTVYQGSPVVSADVGGQAFNYFVPIIQLADHVIDLYQPQAYNNWYGATGGSLEFLKNVYLNWRNIKGIGQWDSPIPNFKGVAGDKLMMGVLASTSAGGAAYYAVPDTIRQFKKWIQENNYPLRGFMMWDSNWDKLNNFVISNACVE
jgi:chitinase